MGKAKRSLYDIPAGIQYEAVTCRFRLRSFASYGNIDIWARTAFPAQ